MELIKVTEARYIGDYKIEFTFHDGKKKVIDLKDELWGDVFKPLKDKDFFRQFQLNAFTIEWENGADFSPEFLYYYGEKKKSEISNDYSNKMDG